MPGVPGYPWLFAINRWGADVAIRAHKRKHPPRYKPPKDIRTRDLMVSDSILQIGGTLVAPGENVHRRTAAIFCAGSGTQDRHGFCGMIDLGYHQLLDGLARHGVVSLRYDKRGTGSTELGEDALRPARAAESAAVEVEMVTLPGLDHLFMRTHGGGLREYSDRRRRVPKDVIETIATWLDRKVQASSVR